MTPPRRAKLVLLVLAVAIVGLGVWRGEAVWMWMSTKRISITSQTPLSPSWAQHLGACMGTPVSQVYPGFRFENR